MNRRYITMCLVLALCSVFCLQAGQYTFSGLLPGVEREPGAVVIRIDAPMHHKQLYIHYKTRGLERSQVRMMKKGKDGHFRYRLPTANLYGDRVEYYIAQSEEPAADVLVPVFTVTGITGKETPEVYFLDAGPGAKPGTKGKSKFKFPIDVSPSLSAKLRIHDKDGQKGKGFDADGNIELSRSFKGKKTSLEFQSDIAYLHHPDEDEQRFNPESMKVKFKLGNHSLTAGDLSIRNSKFTATSLARRGLRYQLKSKRLTLGTFFANSQQKEGFGGFGIPSTDAHIFGAEAAVRFGTNALARCIFMSGKDDMNSKTMVTDDEDFVYRVGNVFSIFGEWKLLKKKLQLKGEFAHSRFGSGESSEEAEKKDGSAWLLDADYKRGIFVFHTAYEKVSRSFSSIGNLFLPNDRQGVNTAVGVKKKAFSANLTYIDITTNIDNDVLPMLHTKEINSKFNWLIDKRFKVGGEFSLNNLDYDNNTGKQEGNKDMDTIRCSVVLGYIAGTNGITFKIGKTESKTFSSNFDGSINVFLKFGKVARLTSILSHQSNNNFTNQSTSKIYNAYLSGNVIFIPEYFSLTLTASGTRNNNSTGANTTVSLRGYLNFHMEQIFKEKIDSTLSLRCIHSSNKNESTDTDKKNTAFYMQLDFSF